MLIIIVIRLKISSEEIAAEIIITICTILMIIMRAIITRKTSSISTRITKTSATMILKKAITRSYAISRRITITSNIISIKTKSRNKMKSIHQTYMG